MSDINTCPHCRRALEGIQREPYVCPHCLGSLGKATVGVPDQRPPRNLDVSRREMHPVLLWLCIMGVAVACGAGIVVIFVAVCPV